MKNEFVLAFNEVIEEKQLPKDVVLEALEAAMVSAYRRSNNASNAQHIEAKIDPETGGVKIYAEKEIVDSVSDDRTEVTLDIAQKFDAEAEMGGMVIVESTPSNFGRVAAQTARQVIQQRIREAERDSQFEHYTQQAGEIVSGVIQAINAQGVALGMEMKAEGLMPRNHQIPGERFRVHDRIRALLLEVKSTPRGPQIILSRAHRNFLRRLLENEVPEIYHGLVEIRSISREPGHRSKVAVSALQAGVDPVGACVGIRGVRIQAIVRELNDEKIDVIEWNPDPTVYIAKALSPARVAGVYLNDLNKNDKTATVVVPEDQLSLAIGRDGQNARLAARLTSWKIDIKSLPEAAADVLFKIQNDEEYAEIALNELEIVPTIENILARKDEGRPVTPEEYQTLTKFVDRVERGFLDRLLAEKLVEDAKIEELRSEIPDAAFEMPLDEFPVSDRVYAVISEGGYETVGALMLQMKLDSDKILALHGMGPKGMQELEQSIDSLTFPEIAPEVEEIEEPESADDTVMDEAGKDLTTEEATSEGESEPTPQEAAEAGEPEEIVAEVPAVKGEEAEALAEGKEVDSSDDKDETKEGEEEVESESFDELFKVESAEFGFIKDEDELEEISAEKKKKKKKYIEIEYDPEEDATIVRKKRKRTADGWEEEW